MPEKNFNPDKENVAKASVKPKYIKPEISFYPKTNDVKFSEKLLSSSNQQLLIDINDSLPHKNQTDLTDFEQYRYKLDYYQKELDKLALKKKLTPSETDKKNHLEKELEKLTQFGPDKLNDNFEYESLLLDKIDKQSKTNKIVEIANIEGSAAKTEIPSSKEQPSADPEIKPVSPEKRKAYLISLQEVAERMAKMKAKAIYDEEAKNAGWFKKFKVRSFDKYYENKYIKQALQEIKQDRNLISAIEGRLAGETGVPKTGTTTKKEYHEILDAVLSRFEAELVNTSDEEIAKVENGEFSAQLTEMFQIYNSGNFEALPEKYQEIATKFETDESARRKFVEEYTVDFVVPKLKKEDWTKDGAPKDFADIPIYASSFFRIAEENRQTQDVKIKALFGDKEIDPETKKQIFETLLKTDFDLNAFNTSSESASLKTIKPAKDKEAGSNPEKTVTDASSESEAEIIADQKNSQKIYEKKFEKIKALLSGLDVKKRDAAIKDFQDFSKSYGDVDVHLAFQKSDLASNSQFGKLKFLDKVNEMTGNSWLKNVLTSPFAVGAAAALSSRAVVTSARWGGVAAASIAGMGALGTVGIPLLAGALAAGTVAGFKRSRQIRNDVDFELKREALGREGSELLNITKARSTSLSYEENITFLDNLNALYANSSENKSENKAKPKLSQKDLDHLAKLEAYWKKQNSADNRNYFYVDKDSGDRYGTTLPARNKFEQSLALAKVYFVDQLAANSFKNQVKLIDESISKESVAIRASVDKYARSEARWAGLTVGGLSIVAAVFAQQIFASGGRMAGFNTGNGWIERGLSLTKDQFSGASAIPQVKAQNITEAFDHSPAQPKPTGEYVNPNSNKTEVTLSTTAKTENAPNAATNTKETIFGKLEKIGKQVFHDIKGRAGSKNLLFEGKQQQLDLAIDKNSGNVSASIDRMMRSLQQGLEGKNDGTINWDKSSDKSMVKIIDEMRALKQSGKLHEQMQIRVFPKDMENFYSKGGIGANNAVEFNTQEKSVLFDAAGKQKARGIQIGFMDKNGEFHVFATSFGKGVEVPDVDVSGGVLSAAGEANVVDPEVAQSTPTLKEQVANESVVTGAQTETRKVAQATESIFMPNLAWYQKKIYDRIEKPPFTNDQVIEFMNLSQLDQAKIKPEKISFLKDLPKDEQDNFVRNFKAVRYSDSFKKQIEVFSAKKQSNLIKEKSVAEMLSNFMLIMSVLPKFNLQKIAGENTDLIFKLDGKDNWGKGKQEKEKTNYEISLNLDGKDVQAAINQIMSLARQVKSDKINEAIKQKAEETGEAKKSIEAAKTVEVEKNKPEDTINPANNLDIEESKHETENNNASSQGNKNPDNTTGDNLNQETIAAKAKEKTSKQSDPETQTLVNNNTENINSDWDKKIEPIKIEIAKTFDRNPALNDVIVEKINKLLTHAEFKNKNFQKRNLLKIFDEVNDLIFERLYALTNEADKNEEQSLLEKINYLINVQATLHQLDSNFNDRFEAFLNNKKIENKIKNWQTLLDEKFDLEYRFD